MAEGIRRGRPKEQPFPYDININGYGFMLGRTKEVTQAELSEANNLASTAPTSYDYSAQNPEVQQTHEWRDLVMGMGLAHLEKGTEDRRTRYTINADTSTGQWLKGPAINKVVPGNVGSGGVTHWFTLNDTLYAASGRYLLKRVSDTSWATAYDFGSGVAITDVLVYQHGATETTYAYIALGASTRVYRYDGTTMFQHPNQTARQTIFFERVNLLSGAGLYTFTLQYGTQTTAPIATSATAVTMAANIQSALRALTGLGAVRVLANNAYEFEVVFDGVSGNVTELVAAITQATHPNEHMDISVETTRPIFQAQAFVVAGGEFYFVDDTNRISKPEASSYLSAFSTPIAAASTDPWDAFRWTTYRIGDKSQPIRRLEVTTSGTLLILKEDGPYTLDDDGNPQALLSGVRFDLADGNGDVAGVFLDEVFMRYGGGLYAINPDLDIRIVGLDRLSQSDAPVGGRITAFAGHGTIGAYAGVVNEDGDSYLMRYGTYASATENPEASAKFLDVWHGAVSNAFGGIQIKSLYKSEIGAAANHSRMYIGLTDGIAWFKLPCTANPLACEEYSFSQDDAYFYLPEWRSPFGNEVSLLKQVTLVSKGLSSTNRALFEYRTTPGTGSWSTLAGNFTSSPRQQIAFPQNTTASVLEVRVILTGDGTGFLSAAALTHSLFVPAVLEHRWLVLASDYLIKRDNTPMRVGTATIVSRLWGARNTNATVRVIAPDGFVINARITELKESLGFDDLQQNWKDAIEVRAIQESEVALYGTYSRLETLGSYTNLEARTYGGLETL